MYAMRRIVSAPNGELELPTCMYQLKNLHGNRQQSECRRPDITHQVKQFLKVYIISISIEYAYINVQYAKLLTELILITAFSMLPSRKG